MIITARFDSRCVECGRSIPKGELIDYSEKKARHVACATNEDESQPTDAHQLASALGYRPHGEAVGMEWSR